MTTRRTFIRNTSFAAGALAVDHTALSPLPSALRAPDPLRIALIGCRNMGFGNLENAIRQPGVECVALCDVDEEVLKRRAEDVGKRAGKTPALYRDFRRVMDDKSIDAVIIGTPDHWHCLPFLAACEAGKDIYVEKPLANSIAECDLMVQYARKYKRVVQVGQQQRSAPHWQQAMELMRSGRIGEIRKVDVWANFNYGVGQPKKPDSAPPPGVDFNMWLGPAPERSFNPTRFHGSWRMFWDYGGGLLTDWGVHLLDMALWVKQVKDTPLAVHATGGNFAFPDNAHETFDTMDVSYQLKDYVIHWSHNAGTQTGPYNRHYGLAFIGNLGTLVINREGWEIIPEKDGNNFKTEPLALQPGKDSHEAHMINFLECIKTRKDPNCTIENGRLVALYAHMGNIALRTGSALQWDERARNFGSNSAANALIRPVYRSPWRIPG